MSFQFYETRFREKATNVGYSEDNIVKCLDYAKKLYDNGLPIIYNLTHFSKLVGFERNFIVQAAVASKHSEAYYRYHKVSKKNNQGVRKVMEPLPNLKEIQHWILQNILERLPPSSYAKAYVKKRGLRQNIRFHKGQKKVYTVDIKDFFPSITFESVENIFLHSGYSDEMSNYLAKLCCLKTKLPQGAPTSPYLSNLVLKDIDHEIAEFCKKNNIRFTRYADDLTFSGDFDEKVIYSFVKGSLEKKGFNLNDDKTKLMLYSQRQIVTGIIVNDKPQLDRETRRFIRKEVYYIKKFGLKSHLEFKGTTSNVYLNQLLGKISFGLYLNPTDESLKKNLKYLSGLYKKVM